MVAMGSGAMPQTGVSHFAKILRGRGAARAVPDATNFRPTAAWISVMRRTESDVAPSASSATNFRPTAAWIFVMRLTEIGARPSTPKCD